MADTTQFAHYPPLQGSARLWGTIALSAATFMNVLDSSIANVSLPAIAGDLGVSVNQGTWVITSFGVANAIALPLTGWLSQRFGQVRLFITSILMFVLASWLCGLAPNMTTLIVFRALQGFVAGPMIPLSQGLLLGSYPPALAGLAMGLWALTTLVAPVLGPLLGGWITDNVYWSWIFYINIPIGLLSAFMVWTIYHKRESITHKLPIDGVGLGLLVLWVGSLQIMLDKGKELDWFHSPLVISLGVVALVGFLFFLAWELTEEHPVVELRLFLRRNFWSGTIAISVGYGLFFGNIVLLPLWLQQFMAYPSLDAGMMLAPVGFFAMILSPIVGKNINKVDPRYLVSFSFCVFALVLIMRSHFNTQADFTTMMVPTVIQGIAMSFFFIPLSVILLSGIRPDKIPAASGLSSFVRIVAGSFGTSIATTVWQDRAAMHHAQLAESINQGNATAMQVLGGLGNAGMTPEQALGQVNRMIDQQAYTLAANDVFFASAMIFLMLIPVVWLSRPKKAGAASADAAAGAH
jgi:MFS transporter, DHA2 family, multidrug resistance protein